MHPPMSSDEPQRLAALRALEILDTPEESSFDAIVRLAARILDVPIALISLVDEDRQWFKARFGLEIAQTSRADSFCAHAVAAGDDIFVIRDAPADERFADNPLVTGEPHIRFYAGRPVHAGGHLVGTLCVIDRRTRSLSADERSALDDLGAVVDDLLDRRVLRSVVAELGRSEARKGQILETMHDGLVLQDADGGIIEWNRAAERVLGLDGDQLVGRTSVDTRWQAVHADGSAWPGETHPAMTALRTGEVVNDALMGVHRPGVGLGWLRVNSTPVRDAVGAITGVITSFADVTDLTGAEHALQRLESLQRSTLDVLEQGVVVVRGSGEIDLMNAAARRILGVEADELAAHWQRTEWLSLTEDGAAVAPAERPLVRTVLGGEAVDSEVVGWQSPTGRFVVLSLSSRPLPEGQNRFVVSFVDISESRRNRELLELTFANAPIGMAMVSDTGEMLAVNDALCTYVGRSRGELLDADNGGRTGLFDIAEVRERCRELLDGDNHRFEIDQQFIRQDSSVLSARLAIAVVRPRTLEHPYFIIQMVDITSRIEAEAAKDAALATEREAVARLVELDRIKSEFVATVSHELRTPLASMIGYIDLLRDDVPPLAPHQVEMLSIVDRSSRRLLDLIEDLLTLSDVEQTERSERVRVDIGAVVRTAIETLGPAAADSDLSLELSLAPAPCLVMSDAAQIERVVLNLVDNAVKFTPRHGRIAVSVRDVGSTVEITVADNGVGIPEDELHRVFTRFFRSSTSVRNAVPGTGLGLAISAEIVGRHRGAITVRRVEPYGTVFTVSLPSA